MIDARTLPLRQFVFCTSEQEQPLATSLRFEANGRIGGYGHSNEHAWAIVDDALHILTRDGEVACIAEPVGEPGGPLEFEGRFLLYGDATHRFTAVYDAGERDGVFSFDLFDTLVFRKCFEPREVFVEMEQRLRLPGFVALRMGAEQVLWQTGDYGFDDIYGQLELETGWPAERIEAMKRLELEIEWDNLCPITEIVQRVLPGDLIVSDMYLPLAFIRRVVAEKCGLPDAPIFLSSHGKNRGTIWADIAPRHRVRRHYGDNAHGDIHMVQQAGLEAEQITTSARTVGERVLALLGMKRVADLIREIRLTFYDRDPARHGAALAQLDVNIPLLILASLAVLRVCADRRIDTALMCSRDCNLWVHLLAQIAEHAAAPPQVRYFTASRVLYFSGGDNYRRYFDQMAGERSLLVDVSGTARSPTHFIGAGGLQDRCSVYLLAYSDVVANFMGTLAPPREDVDVRHLTSQTPFIARIALESMNMSLECRTVGFTDVGGTLAPEVEPPEFDGTAAEMISEMRQLFGITLDALQSTGRDDYAFGASLVDLQKAARLLSLQAIRYHGVLMPIIGTVCGEEGNVKDTILDRQDLVPAWS